MTDSLIFAFIVQVISEIAWPLVIYFLVRLDYQLFMSGRDSVLFTHKTPEEKRLQEAIIQKAEKEAGK